MEQQILNLLLLTSSSSSSSSDDEDFMFMFGPLSDYNMELDLLFVKNERHSVQNFVEEVVAKYTDNEFRKHFRVSRKTAETIAEKFACSKHFRRRSNCSGRKHLSPLSQCLAFLWFAGNKNSYREVSNLFNMTPSSAYRCQTSFLEFLFEISANCIKMPSTSAKKEETAKEFAKLAGFENVLGCIDGCYIYIRSPAHKIRSTYVNRHGLISITLQGICDANKKFLDVFVGAPSKIHDSRIFKLSHISKDLPKICGKKYHILGDAAYPLREYLLTPYRDFGDLTPTQKKYNKKHCQTRVKIENCFGLLKQRFRQLVRLDYFTVMRMSKFVLGCCVLHNLCIDEGDLWLDIDDDTQEEDDDTHEATPETNNNSVLDKIILQKGEIKRDEVSQSMGSDVYYST